MYRLISPHVAAGEKVWFPGQYWSYWYAPLAGGKLTFPGGPQPKPGDLLVVDVMADGDIRRKALPASYIGRSDIPQVSVWKNHGSWNWRALSGFWLWGGAIAWMTGMNSGESTEVQPLCPSISRPALNRTMQRGGGMSISRDRVGSIRLRTLAPQINPKVEDANCQQRDRRRSCQEERQKLAGWASHRHAEVMGDEAENL